MRLAVDDHIIEAGKRTVFDYGCGRGGDLERLTRLGVTSHGWDPVHRAGSDRVPADIVNLGFVVNVIEDPVERQATLRAAWELSREVLIVSARLTTESRDLGGIPFRDGLQTSTGSFQKLFTQDELRAWVESSLGAKSVVAGPGILYVFRHPVFENEWLARRVRRVRRHAPSSSQRLQQHHDIIQPLLAFIEDRGRLPRGDELSQRAAIEEQFGTLRAAFAAIKRVTGTEPWDRIRDARSQDLLVFLALARFKRRPRPKDLPDDMRWDIRDLFGSHTAACAQADRLLFEISNRDRVRAAAGASRVGKRLPAALYVHQDALAELPPILRVLEGAARQLIGDLESTAIAKLHLDRPRVSFLEYPDFDDDPHPALRSGFLVDLRSLRCDYRDYSHHPNPPVLHRKELFLDPTDTRVARFAALTRQEERAGLYAHPNGIGTRRAWSALISQRGLTYRGHRLVTDKSAHR